MSGFDGHRLRPNVSDQVALKTQEVVDGTVTTTYVAVAPVGTALSDAKWSVRKVVYDSATGITLVTWASTVALGPTPRFVHVATDLTVLTYG